MEFSIKICNSEGRVNIATTSQSMLNHAHMVIVDCIIEKCHKVTLEIYKQKSTCNVCRTITILYSHVPSLSLVGIKNTLYVKTPRKCHNPCPAED